MLIGEWLKDVLDKVHFAVKRFHLQVTHNDVREILTELEGVNLCQLCSASESASISFKVLMLMLYQTGQILTLPENRYYYFGR